MSKNLAARCVGSGRLDRQAVDRHDAPLEGFKAVEATQKGAFASSGRSDDRRDLAAVHREAEPLEHLDRAVALGQASRLDHGGCQIGFHDDFDPPFASDASNRRSDHREKNDSGTLMPR